LPGDGPVRTPPINVLSFHNEEWHRTIWKIVELVADWRPPTNQR
jgi:hypothetical protein